MALSDNAHFQTFRRKLREAGIELKPWATLDGPAYGFNIIGAHPDAPRTMIVMDYGPRDGFATFYETTHNSLKADLDMLTGAKA